MASTSQYIKGLVPRDRLYWHIPGEWMDLEMVSSNSYIVLRSSQDCTFQQGRTYTMIVKGFKVDKWNVVKGKEFSFDKLYLTLKQ